MLAAVVAARLNGLRGSQAVEVAAREVAGQAQRARQLALSRAEPVRLRLDLAGLAAEVRGLGGEDPGDGAAARTALRNGNEALTATFVRDDRIATAGASVDLLFWPDGRSDPAGTWSIAGAGRRAAVRIPGGPLPVTVSIAGGEAHAP